jgi:cysteine desulfurase
VIYFDHNATTPVDERVLEAMLPFINRFYGNPSSLYKLGRLSRSAIETAREQVAALVNVTPEQIIFTSGGTEANTLALQGSYAQFICSAIEHPSILDTMLCYQQRGKRVDIIPVDSQGMINEQALENIPLYDSVIISMMLANNETGCLQPIEKYSHKLWQGSPIFHTDAVQAFGKIPIDFNQLGVNLMSISGHKIYAPKILYLWGEDKKKAGEPAQKMCLPLWDLVKLQN